MDSLNTSEELFSGWRFFKLGEHTLNTSDLLKGDDLWSLQDYPSTPGGIVSTTSDMCNRIFRLTYPQEADNSDEEAEGGMCYHLSTE